MAVKTVERVFPCSTIDVGFDDGVPREDVGVWELGEDELGVVQVGIGGTRADELDGDEIWVERKWWVSDELGLDLEELLRLEVLGVI